MRVIIITLLLIAALWFGKAIREKYYYGEAFNFDGTRFFDKEAPMDKSFSALLKWKFSSDKSGGLWPENVGITYDKPPARVSDKLLRVSYVGHMTTLIQLHGINIITDPIWSERASPFKFIGPKRVTPPGIKFEDLPKIDLVLISHNHYDHMDAETIKMLVNRDDPVIITTLGNDYLIKQFAPKARIMTGNWGEEIILGKISVYIEKVQHWSARWLTDHRKALWGGFVIDIEGDKIYFSGDTGYGNGANFVSTKKKHGIFRLAILPIGAYLPRWFMKYSHLSPSETVEVHKILGNPATLASHYDVFKLADEAYGEATKDLLRAIEEKGADINKFIIIKPGEARFID